MSRPTRSTARIATAIAIPAALAVSGAIVGHASYSAYSSTASNPTSNWRSGTVNISGDDSQTALFSASGLKPGSADSKCIAVTSTGSLASTVKLYGTGYATTKNLASSINLKIEQGTGGNFGSCTGFTAQPTGGTVFNDTLAAFSGKTNYSTGLTTWSPTGTDPETKVFKITYTLDPSAPDSTQGGTAGVGFTWEAQNN